jgi:hypothetical protein
MPAKLPRDVRVRPLLTPEQRRHLAEIHQIEAEGREARARQHAEWLMRGIDGRPRAEEQP